MAAGAVGRDSIAAAVRAAGCSAVSSVRDVPTLSGNIVYDVRTHDGRFAVRFPKNAMAIAREQRIGERLRGIVPVPEVLLADSSGMSAGRPVQVSRWVEGDRLDAVLEANREVDAIGVGRAVGVILGRLAGVELAAPGWLVGTGLDVEQRERRLADGIRRHVRERVFGTGGGQELAPDVRLRFWRLVESRVDTLSALDDDRSLVHGDLIRRNLLVRQDGVGWTVVAVLDWEFAMAGPTLRDMGNVMRGAPPTFLEGLATGFRGSGGTLPDNWRELAWLLDTVSLTGPLARPKGHPDRVLAERLIADAVHASGVELRPD